MKDTIVVKQERGKDSTVKVFAETRDTFAGPKSFLRFESDQILTSESKRSWTTYKAIEAYCIEHGYRLDMPVRKYDAVAHYSARMHSFTETHKIACAIQEDERYLAVEGQARIAAAALNQEYGKRILQLENLVRALEQQINIQLQKERDVLLALQVEIVQENELPDHVSVSDKKRLLEPKHPLAQLSYDRSSKYAGRDEMPPQDIGEILEMAKCSTG